MITSAVRKQSWPRSVRRCGSPGPAPTRYTTPSFPIGFIVKERVSPIGITNRSGYPRLILGYLMDKSLARGDVLRVQLDDYFVSDKLLSSLHENSSFGILLAL